MQDNSINISYCLCETNWEKVYISIISLMENTNHHINLYLTHDEWLNEDTKIMFSALCDKYSQLSMNFISMNKVLFEKYHSIGYLSPYSFHRTVLLKLCPAIDRIIILTANAIVNDDLWELYTTNMGDNYIASKNCKDEIRNLFNHILPKECFCTVHSSDGKDECKYLASILLSPNNIKHLKMRLNYETDGRLVKLLRDLPDYLKNKEINIPSNDICVIGTGVLSALGINKRHISLLMTIVKVIFLQLK